MGTNEDDKEKYDLYTEQVVLHPAKKYRQAAAFCCFCRNSGNFVYGIFISCITEKD